MSTWVSLAVQGNVKTKSPEAKRQGVLGRKYTARYENRPDRLLALNFGKRFWEAFLRLGNLGFRNFNEVAF